MSQRNDDIIRTSDVTVSYLTVSYVTGRVWQGLLLAVLFGAAGADAMQNTGSNDMPDKRRIVAALQALGVGQDQLDLFVDHVAITPHEATAAQQIAAAFSRFDRPTREAWQTDIDDWAILASQSVQHRWQLFRVAGRVQAIVRLNTLPQSGTTTAPDFASNAPRADSVFALTVAATGGGHPLTVITNSLPSQWSEKRFPVNAPFSCDALFAKNCPEENAPTDAVRLAFVTNNIRWHPNQADAAFGVTSGAAVLGSHGFDHNVFSQVVQRGKLTERDRECFYRLLWTTRRMSAQASASSPRRLPIVDVLKSPHDHRGELFRVRGIARRAIRIRVTDPDIQQQLGIDHYFEVEMFLPLEPALRLIEATDGTERVYNNYPITVCCSQLPKEMPQGDLIRREVEIDAFLMKLWSYRSQFAAGEDQDNAKRQISPLLIAKSLRIPAPVTQRNSLPAWMLASVLLSCVVFAVVAKRLYANGDKHFASWRSNRRAHDERGLGAIEKQVTAPADEATQDQ